MKSASAPLLELLNSGRQFWIADLYTLTLASGAAHRFTSADRDLVHDGAQFFAGSLKFVRERVRVVTGLEVDELRVVVHSDGETLLGADRFLPFARAGGLDGATLALERAFMAEFGDVSAGAVPLFFGRVADVTLRRTSVELMVKSPLELLNVKLPRNVYQPTCLHTVYDAGCGLDRSAFAVAATVAPGSTFSIVNTALVEPAGWFDLGLVRFESGPAAGHTRTVKSYASGMLTLATPLLSTPAVGDRVTVWPGCDRLQATCQNKFDNLANFRGFPYIPEPETAR